MLERFRKAWEGLSCPGDGAVLLAVSGGVDSMTMADLFYRSGIPVRVLHCNFSLRGSESDADEALVRDWCGERSLPFESVRFDTRAHAAQRGVSLEMAARELRYAWFARRSAACGNAPVAVAHHLEDNAETLLLNLLRGTGIDGLRGMRPARPLPGAGRLVRPLLGFSRADIAAYAAGQGVPFREDASNSDTRIKRNLIRHEVLPVFDRINPSWRETLARDTERFGEAARIVDRYCREHSPAAASPVEASGQEPDGLLRAPEGRIVWDLAALRAEPEGEYLLYRFLRERNFPGAVAAQIWSALTTGRPTAGMVFRSGSGPVAAGCPDATGRQGASWSLALTADRLIVEPAAAPDPGPWTIPGPGEYDCGGIRVAVSLEEPPADAAALRCPEGVSVFDAGKVPFPLTLRRWRAGDWLRPIGLGGRKKLSDLFTDLHFDRLRKEKALILADEGSHVFSLLGFRTDEAAQVVGRTRTLLKIKIR